MGPNSGSTSKSIRTPMRLSTKVTKTSKSKTMSPGCQSTPSNGAAINTEDLASNSALNELLDKFECFTEQENAVDSISTSVSLTQDSQEGQSSVEKTIPLGLTVGSHLESTNLDREGSYISNESLLKMKH